MEALDIGLFRGIVTAVLFVAFVGTVIWAWSHRRKADFEQAARLPLESAPKTDRENDDG